MDQEAQETKLPPHHEETHPQVIKKGGGFFAFLGKVFIFLIIIGLLVGTGYYLGTTNNLNANPTPSPTSTATTSPTQIPLSPTAASQNTKTVKAGLSGATSFKAYAIEVPAGWTDARETTLAAGIDKLTLTKSGYSVTIYQAPMGGGGCIYEGDPPNEMAQLYTDFAEINGKSGQYRRSWTEGPGQSVTYAICQKGVENSYGIMTSFGAISVVTPNPADPKMLSEVDGMIASLVNQ